MAEIYSSTDLELDNPPYLQPFCSPCSLPGILSLCTGLLDLQGIKPSAIIREGGGAQLSLACGWRCDWLCLLVR